MDTLSVQPVQNQGTISSVGTVENQTPITQNTNSSSSALPNTSQPNSGIDRSALHLTHAIALAESNANYNAVGDKGTSIGAYQWHDANGNGMNHFASDAKAAGLDPNDFSPENQDKVAYTKIKKWKDQGYDPGQIASMWNSGQPDNWQNHSGPGYNTPAYVQRVYQHYQQLSQNDFNAHPFSNPNPGDFDFSNLSKTEENQNNKENNAKSSGWLSNLIGPELTGLATGARAIQSSWDLAKGIVELAKNDPATLRYAILHPSENVLNIPSILKAKQTQEQPIGETKTAAGMNNKELLGTGAQAAGQGLTLGTGGILTSGALGLGLQSAGNAAANNEDTSSIAKEGLIGSALGAAGVAASPLIGKLLSGAYEAVVPQVAKDAISATGELVNKGLGKIGEAASPILDKVVPSTMTKSISENAGNLLGKFYGQKWTNDLANTYDEIFTGTKAGKKGLLQSAKMGNQTSKFLSENGILPDIDSANNRWNMQPAIERLQQEVQPLNQSARAIAELESKMPDVKTIDLDSLGTKVKAKLNTANARGAGLVEAQNQAIDDEIANLQAIYGPKVNAQQLDEIRMGQWSQSKTLRKNPQLSKGAFQPDIHFALGQSARDALVEGDNALAPKMKPILKEASKYYDAIQQLGKVDGNAIKGGRSFIKKMSDRIIGSVIGSHFGPLGSVAGEYVGGYISDLMSNNAISNPIKKSVLESIPRESPVYQEAQKALKELNKGLIGKLIETPQLPAPSYIPAGPRTYEETPPQLLEAERGLGRVPKGKAGAGQVFRYYKSTPK